MAKVELPGVHEEDLNVSVVGDMLVVEGEKESGSEVKRKGYYYSESAYGSFSRSIMIPSVVDVDKITANFDKGVLKIDLPKAETVKPRKVNVTTQKKPKTAAKTEKTTGNSEKPGDKHSQKQSSQWRVEPLTSHYVMPGLTRNVEHAYNCAFGIIPNRRRLRCGKQLNRNSILAEKIGGFFFDSSTRPVCPVPMIRRSAPASYMFSASSNETL